MSNLFFFQFYPHLRHHNVFDARGLQHALGGGICLGAVVLVVHTDDALDAALDYELGALVAGKEAHVDAAAVERAR